MAYRVSVNPQKKGRPGAGLARRRCHPGTTFLARERLTLPRGLGYTVSVSLPALDQRLRAHCRGRSS